MDGCERTQSIQSEKGRDVNNRIKKNDGPWKLPLVISAVLLR